MDATNRPARAGARQARTAVLVTVLVLTGSAASAMAAGVSPSRKGAPEPVVTAPVLDPADLWTGATDDAAGDMAPMVDPVEDVDDSALEAASLDDGDMAPMVDPVEDVDESALGE